ncbi:efflux RND transporter permease subunit [Gloeobacter kilaueensis]|uniref:Acriflavin resistance protein n=1 Tax=Gloeobacter kilaueensis (strain ATCC BAA-2537 / CCAP 1431/1 / ULC 316 / JS1) TaxID=1183438 RepID=U5QSE4_GLOK1|nr:efflux RND transporter permease subunit [Gloeobacter kilaueensis]AGY60650.1 acriflavin resistance protein [Gloeobacter kilaueensis JS1]
MNWNISAWSIRNPVPTIVLFLVLTVAGVVSFFSLGIDENPNIDVPMVSVTITQTGAAPSELETQVTRKVEDSVAGIGNVEHIISTVTDGASTTQIKFVLGTNTDRAVNDVRDAVTKIRQQLPQGINEPIVQRIDFAGGPFISFAVASNRRTPVELSWLVDNDIARALLSVPGVSQVQRSGGVDREIRIFLDPNRLQALGVTADQVNAQIRALNIDLPGGRGEVGTTEQAIRTLGSAPSVEKLRATQIVLPNGTYARLDTIGTVSDGAAEQRQLAFIDGKPAVAFSVVRSTGSNVVDVEKSVQRQIEQLRHSLPADIDIDMIRTTARFVHMSYDASVEALLLGATLAVIVIWFFLRDWRSTAIAAIAMPLSAIPTFALMKVAGFTLNNMSMLALSLVVGILVDDAIVEIENIVRHIGMGKRPFQAALDAADEIGLAVVATTMTIVVVFLPVAFMGGIPGQFFKQFGWTVAAAVLFSLVVARMATPLMAAYLMKPLPHASKRGWLVRTYDRILLWALRHRFATILAAVGFFVASLALVPLIPTSLIDAVDRGETVLSIELPPGSSLSDTRRVVKQITGIVQSRPEAAKVFSSLGTPSSNGSGSSSGAVNKASIYIVLKPKEERKLSQAQFEAAIRKPLLQVPGVRISSAGTGVSGGKPLQIVLTGDDPATLKQAADALTDQIRSVPGLIDVTSSAALLRPEILVRPDFARAADQGVSVQSIARTALIASLGDIDANLAKFNLADRQINIRVQLDPRFRDDLQTISNLQVVGNNGLVPLKSVASIGVGSGAAQIDRYDRARQVSIDANLGAGTELGPALQAVHKLSAYRNLPAGVREQPAGDTEIQRDVFSGFGFAIATAVLLIYAVLVLLFGGFMQPLTIMMSLPLSLGGALIGLLVFGKSLGLYALIGIIMLMGLVTKNAILLVEYGLMAMKEGTPRMEAILSAGEARMRPILMTTIAMIAGMLPIALGIGAGSEVRAPMAVAVVGGLVTSTLLTLVVIPVVFTCIDDLQNWLARIVRRQPRELTEAYRNPAVPSPSQQQQ